jgi:hypothetical protein
VIDHWSLRRIRCRSADGRRTVHQTTLQDERIINRRRVRPQHHAESPEDVAFVKALVSASEKVSPALLQELRKALGEKRGRSPDPSHRPLHQVAAKRKANELTDSVCSSEPASRRPAPDVESALAAGEQAAFSGRQHGSPEGATTYAAVAAGPVAPQQPGGQLKPAAKGQDSSKPAASSEYGTRAHVK